MLDGFGGTMLYTILGNASRAKLVTNILGNNGSKGKHEHHHNNISTLGLMASKEIALCLTLPWE